MTIDPKNHSIDGSSIRQSRICRIRREHYRSTNWF